MADQDVRVEEVAPNDPNLRFKGHRSTLDDEKLRRELQLGTDPAKPDFESAFHSDQIARWAMIDALMDGTEGMRRAGAAYMPRYDQEAEDTWRRRVGTATLLNYFRKTVEAMVGKPLGKPVQLPEDMSPEVEAVLEDMDGHGQTIDMFAQRTLERGLSKGIIHTLVDMPRAPELPEGQDRPTAADEEGMQPRVIIYEPEALIGAKQDADGCLTQVRLREISMEPSGEYGEAVVVRIRVLEPGKWTLFRREKKGSGRRWVQEGSGAMVDAKGRTLTEIPFVTFKADDEGFMRSRPPLLDLAYKNIEHWQSSSDQRNILTVTRFPILVGTGVNPQDPIALGPNNYIGLRDAQGSMKYVETTGNAIAAGRQDMEDLKAEMAVLGLTLLMPQQPGQPTATAKAMDGAESVTELQRIVLSFQEFLNDVKDTIEMWLGEDPDAIRDKDEIVISQDYAKLLNMDGSVQALLSARGSRDISRKTLLDGLKRRGYLAPDFDADEDAELLSQEKAQTGDGMPPRIPGKPGLLPAKAGEDAAPAPEAGDQGGAGNPPTPPKAKPPVPAGGRR